MSASSGGSPPSPSAGPATGAGWLLAIDSSGASPGLLVAGQGACDFVVLDAAGPARAEDLAAEAARLLAARGIAAADLEVLAAVTGPGSYTGLRAGLAFLRGLAFGATPRVVAVGSLELLAWRAGQPGEVLVAAWPATEGRFALAACRRGDDDVAELLAPELASTEEFADFCARLSPAPVALVAPAPVHEALSAAAARAALPLRAIDAGGLESLAGLASSRAARGVTVAIDALLPLYVGQSSARPNRNRVALAEASSVTR